MQTTLIDARALAAAGGRADWVVVDCRYDLGASGHGFQAFLAGHVPGAVYADLARDLSGPPITDRGRHPLPSPEQLCERFSALGIDAHRQVVAYDDAGGSMAGRLWWMLRYMGHFAVAVLDGGWPAWRAARGPIATGPARATPRRFAGRPRRDRLLTIDELAGLPLVDARDPARYRGEAEPIDPRAGHIPGAANHCWKQNLDPTGCFKPPAALREAFQASLGTLPDGETVHYCGSGVSACHNILAQLCAGLPEPRLYCGSWSEWCRDPERPAALGCERGAARRAEREP